MKIVVISDTHGREAELGVLEGDVLVHCGDVMGGLGQSDADLDRLDDWLGRQRFRHILVVGGNHDFALQRRAQRSGGGSERVLRSATYLEDDGVVIDGLRFYGAPWIPALRGFAYYQRRPALARRWAAIPDDTDVLITHTPPRGVLNRTRRGQAIGCPSLRRRLLEVRPRLHCFGHVHASGGRLVGEDGTRFVNASMVTHRSASLRAPMTLHLPTARAVGC